MQANQGKAGQGNKLNQPAKPAAGKNIPLDDNTIKNEQLLEQYAEELKTGYPVIFAIRPTTNDNFVDVYMIQQREITRAANVGSPTTQRPLSKREIQMKGFNNAQAIRHRDVYNTTAVKDAGWEVGTVLEGMMISCMDSLIPRDDVQGARPRANSQGYVLLSADEELPIYRHTGLYDEEDCPPDHVLDFTVSETTVKEFSDEYASEAVEEGVQ